MDLENGVEILIPKELSQDHMPPSYRYYDHILMLIQDKVTQNRRDFAKMKGKLGVVFEEKLALK